MRPVMPHVRNWSRSALCCAFVWAAPAVAAPAADAPATAEAAVAQATTPVPVKVERVKPAKPKLPTLRFLRTNRDFVRGRLDLLRERPLEQDARSREMDPRFLAYRELLAGVEAAGDSAAAIAQSVEGRELFASVTELGALEAQLDEIGRLLADQELRLAALQQDFAGRQRTELVLLLTGLPEGLAPATMTWVREEGDSLRTEWSETERASLRTGGTFEWFHGLVEPREQVLEFAFAGNGWDGAPHAFVTIEPGRDEMTFLRLDLSAVRAPEGAAAIRATSWRQPGAEVLGAMTRP